LIKKCNIYKVFKRLLDLGIACVALTVLMPLLLLVMTILKVTGEGEIFYLQERIGYKNSKFKIWKFATMLKNSLDIGTGSITLENDFRVTKFGKFLRKTKINELPQLYNIVKGDITLVGPRPVLDQDWKLYPDSIINKIYDVKPGLTGIGSIIFRDEESLISAVKGEDYHEFYKRVIAPYKGNLEIWYQKNMSMFVDIKLILLTALVIILPNNSMHNLWFKDLPKRDF
jgi:lipopolysaccharide/colanic/teichoic acid biosynthesis glycosyltransferase